jgi:hypothetical protein
VLAISLKTICGWRLCAKCQVPTTTELNLKKQFLSQLTVAEEIGRKKRRFRKE